MCVPADSTSGNGRPPKHGPESRFTKPDSPSAPPAMHRGARAVPHRRRDSEVPHVDPPDLGDTWWWMIARPSAPTGLTRLGAKSPALSVIDDPARPEPLAELIAARPASRTPRRSTAHCPSRACRSDRAWTTGDPAIGIARRPAPPDRTTGAVQLGRHGAPTAVALSTTVRSTRRPGVAHHIVSPGQGSSDTTSAAKPSPTARPPSEVQVVELTEDEISEGAAHGGDLLVEGLFAPHHLAAWDVAGPPSPRELATRNSPRPRTKGESGPSR